MLTVAGYQVDILAVEDFRMDGGVFFGIVPKVMWLKSWPHVDDLNRVQERANVWLLRGHGRTILMDGGLGTKLGEKKEDQFDVKRPRGTLTDVLAGVGVKPDDVTDFIYSHLHFDHCGGATYIDESGALRPQFPKAKHFIQKKHLAWGRNPSDKDRATFFSESWEPVAEAGLMQELDGEAEIYPGLKLIPVNGHTESMQILQVSDDRDGCVFAVDMIPTTVHLTPHYTAALDNQPLVIVDERKEWMKKIADNRWKLGFPHDPFTPLVTLTSQADGKYSYESVEI